MRQELLDCSSPVGLCHVGAVFLATVIKTFVLGVCGVLLVLFSIIGIPSAVLGEKHCRIPENTKELRYFTPTQFLRVIMMCSLICFALLRITSFSKHFKLASFAGLLVLPVLVWHENVLFVGIWFAFVLQLIQTARFLLNNEQLARVYVQFLLVFRLCFTLSMCGFAMFCILVLCAFVDVDHFALYVQSKSIREWMRESLLLLFYGGYFGVLHRDASQLLHQQVQMKRNTTKYVKSCCCALCGKYLIAKDEEEAKLPTAVNEWELECGHAFHEYCLRGWSVFGKRGCCAICFERSHKMEQLYANIPWEKTSLDWLNYLYVVRHVVLYVPCLMHLFRFAWFATTRVWYRASFNEHIVF